MIDFPLQACKSCLRIGNSLREIKKGEVIRIEIGTWVCDECKQTTLD